MKSSTGRSQVKQNKPNPSVSKTNRQIMAEDKERRQRNKIVASSIKLLEAWYSDSPGTFPSAGGDSHLNLLKRHPGSSDSFTPDEKNTLNWIKTRHEEILKNDVTLAKQKQEAEAQKNAKPEGSTLLESLRFLCCGLI